MLDDIDGGLKCSAAASNWALCSRCSFLITHSSRQTNNAWTNDESIGILVLVRFRSSWLE